MGPMLRTNRTGAVVAAALLVAAVIGFAGINPYLPGGGDNAGYIAEAESLLTLGHRARLYEAGTPPATLKPPLFPVLLAGVESLFGRNVAAMKALLALFAVGAVAAAWWALRVGLDEGGHDRDGRGTTGVSPVDCCGSSGRQAAFVALWFALSPALTRYTHDVISDVPFALCALLAFGLAARLARPGGRAWAVPVLAGVVLAAGMLRAAGVIVAGACGGYLALETLVRRREEGGVRRAAGAILCFLLALAVLAYFSQGEQSYAAHLKNTPGTSGFWYSALADRLARTVRFYVVMLPGEIAAYPLFGPEFAIYVLAAVTGGVALAGAVTLLRRRCWLIPVVFLLYHAALLLAPWLDRRYYLPTLPLLMALLWCGAETIIGWAHSLSRAVRSALVFLLTLAPLVSLIATVLVFGQREPEALTIVEWLAGAVAAAALACWVWRAASLSAATTDGLRNRLGQTLAAVLLSLALVRGLSENVAAEWHAGPAPTGRGWPELYAAAQYLGAEAAPADAVVSARPSLIWFWAGLRGIPVPRTDDSSVVRTRLAGARWLVLDEIGEDQVAPRFLTPYVRAHPAEWVLRWRQGNTCVFRRRGG